MGSVGNELGDRFRITVCPAAAANEGSDVIASIDCLRSNIPERNSSTINLIDGSIKNGKKKERAYGGTRSETRKKKRIPRDL